KRHGGFYTQEDVREIVAYAADRFVTIVPEIEMPGHSQATIAAYPALGNLGDTIKPWTMWGVSNYILNPSDTTVRFMQDVLTEVMALFPAPYIHIGGDEAANPQWKASSRAQAKISEPGIAPDDPADTRHPYRAEDELQSWFIKQMDAFLTAHGRRLVGWDEILDGGLAPNAVVMSWRGTAGGIAAAGANHDVIMTPGSHTYFDHYQAKPDSEPLAIGGFLPIDNVYSYEPVPAGLEPEFAAHILGAQAQVWTEYIEAPKNVEYMAFPRVAALAEVLWTSRERRDFRDFSSRLPRHLQRLDALDVNYRRPKDELWPIGTFSILAYDPATGELGGAVQSRVFSVGNGVLWAEAGVGVAATQAIVDVSYGAQALELLRSGMAPEAIIKQIRDKATDPLPENWTKQGRQFAVMNLKGEYAAFTGPKATAWAGHKGGKFCTAQGNILAGAAVVGN